MSFVAGAETDSMNIDVTRTQQTPGNIHYVAAALKHNKQMIYNIPNYDLANVYYWNKVYRLAEENK